MYIDDYCCIIIYLLCLFRSVYWLINIPDVLEKEQAYNPNARALEQLPPNPAKAWKVQGRVKFNKAYESVTKLLEHSAKPTCSLTKAR